MENKLSMREFTLDFLKKNPGYNPNSLAQSWHEYKTGRYAPAASRKRFGITSAAYRTLRKLQEEGLVTSTRDYEFYLKHVDN